MGNWKRVVFLDIDSVVNSEQWYLKTRGKSGHFDPKAIAFLNQLKDIGAEVVVSSSGVTEHFHVDWLCRGNEIEKWLLLNFKGMGTRYGLAETGYPYYRKHFGDADVDYEYVILDDDTDFLLGQKDNFIHVSRQTGLTQADIDKAIKILTREN